MTKILVTGASGFIGSALCKELEAAGHEVWKSMRYVSGGRFGYYEQEHTVFFDLRDAKETEAAILTVNPEVIFHLAAQSAVAYSFPHPIEVFNVVANGTVHVAEAARKTGAWLVAASCYDPKTRAYVVGEGFKSYWEIKPGDRTLALNPATGAIEEAVIEHLTVQEYAGPMFAFKGRRADFLVTPNHKMAIERIRHHADKEPLRHGALEFVEAREAARLTGFWLPTGHWGGEAQQSPIKGIALCDLCYLVGLFIGDGNLNTTYRQERKTGLNRAAYMLQSRGAGGQFIALPAKPDTQEYSSPRIYLYIPPADGSRKKVEDTLTRVGAKWASHGKTGMIYVSDPRLVPVFAACGKYAENKRIPRWFLGLPPVYLAAILEGLMDSDGDQRGRRQYSTVSKGLVADMVELCAKIGKTTAVRTIPPKNVHFKDGHVSKSQTSYQVNVAHGLRYLTKHQGNVAEVLYAGQVWCPVVPGYGNLLVERNGKVAFCGNSSEVYGRIEEHTFPLTEDQRTGGTSPYAAAKCAAEEYLRVLRHAYKLPVTIVRPFNSIGRAHLNNRQFVVERTVTQAIEEGVISLSDPTPLRDFVFRADHVGAYLAVLSHREQAVGETFNFCTGDAWEIRRMAEYVARAVGTRMNKLVVVSWNRGPDRPWDIPRLQGSNEKAKKLLAWQPKYTIATALDKVVDEWLSVLRK